MFESHVNSIAGVTEACEKLKVVMEKKYPTTKNSRFDIGIDPLNGKYTIVVFLSDPAVFKRIPPTVKGYKVVDGFKPLDLNLGMDNA